MLGRLIILFSTLFFLSGCQTSMVRSFDKIHAGMDKGQVLELVGTPDTSNRFHGKDRWIWGFYEEGIRFEKEVHFADSTVVYVGDAYEPPVEKSAAVADQRDQQIEAKAQEEYRAEADAKKQRAAAAREARKAAEEDAKKVHYLPKFVDLK